MTDVKHTPLSLVFLLFLINVGAAFAAIWQLDSQIFGIDDAYIYFVYAKNFLLGGEFVYNLGGERVEGFSSPLWMAICIAAMWLSAEPQIPLLLIAAALGTTIMLLCIRLTETLCSGQDEAPTSMRHWHLGTWLMLAVWFANPSWFVWNLSSLMETPLWGALIAGATTLLMVILHRDGASAAHRRTFTLLMALLAIARPEAPLWIGWFLLAYVVILRVTGMPSSQALKAGIAPLLAALLCTAMLFAVRYNYFGYWFANTYYAKMSPNFGYNLVEGIKYLGDFSAKNGIAVLGILAALWSFLRIGPRVIFNWLRNADQRISLRDAELFILSGTAMAGIAAALITGGDKFGGFRFYQSFLPLLYVLMLHVCLTSFPRFSAALSTRYSFGNGLAIATLTALSLTLIVSANWTRLNRTNLAIEFDIAEQMRLSAKLLDRIYTTAGYDLPRVAVIPAGGFKFDSQATVYDLMGLNLTTMAHSGVRRDGIKNHAAFDPEIFFQLEPQILGARTCRFDDEPWTADRFEVRVLKGLPLDESFTSRFKYAHYRLKGEPYWLCSYIENSLYAELADNPLIDIHTSAEHAPDSHLVEGAPAAAEAAE